MDKGYHRNETANPLLYRILKDMAHDNKNHLTPAESVVWQHLRGIKEYKFRAQHIIGDYIVDFVCLKKKLIIEIDGEYHFTEEQEMEDRMREQALTRLGYKIIRFTNQEVLNGIETVIETIKNELK